MKSKPDINSFLGGGAADEANTNHSKKETKIAENINVKIHREQKIFRLPIDLISILKRESYERSVSSGVRVTETDLVEKALRKFFK